MRKLASSILHLAHLSAATAFNWWEEAEDPNGLTCDFRPQQQLKVGEDREEVCMELGQAICRDNGDPLREWQFGVLDPDEQVALLDPNGKAVYKDFPGATSLCFGEEEYEGFYAFQPPPQPYLYFYDDCNDAVLAELICNHVPEENQDDPTILKMTDNTDIGDDIYDPVNIVKLRKGTTEDPTDDNLLWGIDVDFKKHPLEGQIVTNKEFCVWEEYYSSARCASANCELVDCCDVYEDDESYVFPICEGSQFCMELLNKTVIDQVEITFDGICEDLDTNETGPYNVNETFPNKTSLEEALKRYFDDLVLCEQGGTEECVVKEDAGGGRNLQPGHLDRRRKLVSEPRLDTIFTELFEYQQIDICLPFGSRRRRLAGRNQKSKGRFNRGRRGNNRRRKRKKKNRRSRVLTEMLTKNKGLRRALREVQCPPSLTRTYKEQGFTSVDEVFDLGTSAPVDCSVSSSDSCTGADGAFSCCGFNECSCSDTVSKSRCQSLGCRISSDCCEFFPDVCTTCTAVTFKPSGQAMGALNSVGVAVADVNGDGHPDAVFANYAGSPPQPNQVWLNDGTGIFLFEQDLGLEYSESVALGDLNGDGHPDAVFTNCFGYPQVYFNQGSGTFAESNQTFDYGCSVGLALGDVDKDGDLDIVFGYNDDDQVWINDGLNSGNFILSQTLSNGDSTYGVALGDLNEDTYLDIVFANWGNENTVWLNNGNGTFTDSGQQLGPSSGDAYTYRVALADVDCDGDLDAVFANEQGDENKLYLNLGNGTLVDSNQNLGEGNSYGVAVGDLDGDGGLDIVFANVEASFSIGSNDDDEEANSIWINSGDCTGIFSLDQSLGSSDSSSVALADVDGDSKLDIIFANDDELALDSSLWLQK